MRFGCVALDVARPPPGLPFVVGKRDRQRVPATLGIVVDQQPESVLQCLMLNSFQTTDFVKGLLYIFDLPDDIEKETFDKLPEDKYLAIYIVLGTWERLGILVHRNETSIDLVDDAFSGPIIQSWQKLGNFVIEFRRQVQRDTAFEWFQWLVERMKEREQHGSAIPAYITHKNWKPKAR